MVRAAGAQAAAGRGVAGIIGKTGSYKDFGLPSWYAQPTAPIILPPGSRDAKLQWQTGFQKESSVMHALGLTMDTPSIIVPTPVGNVTVSDSLARKLMTREDSGHFQLLRAGYSTFRIPREVWEEGEKRRFFGLYHLGDERRITQMAVAHQTGEFDYTIYEVDDSMALADARLTRDSIEARTNAKRRGTCLYLAHGAL